MPLWGHNLWHNCFGQCAAIQVHQWQEEVHYLYSWCYASLSFCLFKIHCSKCCVPLVSYTRAQKSNDTVVVLQGEKFGIICSILSCTLHDAQEVDLIVREPEVEDSTFCGAPHILAGKFSFLKMVFVAAVLRKAVRVDVESSVCL